MSIFITGGTGFIGRKLVKKLLYRRESVHLLSRKHSDLRGLQRGGVKIFYGDVTNEESLRPAMQDCQRVFHLAAYARNWARHPSVYYRVNIEGFRNVAEIALDNKIEKIVFTSSAMTFGPTSEQIGNEKMSRKPKVFFTEYEKTKYLAEIESEKLLEKSLPLVIVNPTRVYGPGKMTEGNSVTRMIEMYIHGRFPIILGKGLEIGNYVYIDDVVDGHLKAMSKGKIGQKYILGGENSSLNHFFSLLSHLSGKKPPPIHIPPNLAKLFAKVEKFKAMIMGTYPLITTGWVETFLRNWAFSSEKAISELGYCFTGLKQGLELTYNWLRDNKPREL